VTITISNPEAIAEIKYLMDRFQFPAELVVERVLMGAGVFMPMEMLGYPDPYWNPREPNEQQPSKDSRADAATE
jgi:hypothetical protein